MVNGRAHTQVQSPVPLKTEQRKVPHPLQGVTCQGPHPAGVTLPQAHLFSTNTPKESSAWSFWKTRVAPRPPEMRTGAGMGVYLKKIICCWDFPLLGCQRIRKRQSRKECGCHVTLCLTLCPWHLTLGRGQYLWGESLTQSENSSGFQSGFWGPLEEQYGNKLKITSSYWGRMMNGIVSGAPTLTLVS